MVKPRRPTFVMLYTITRPYISLRGARRRGPEANPSTKTETENVANNVDVVSKSSITCCTAGASIVDTSGLIGQLCM